MAGDPLGGMAVAVWKGRGGSWPRERAGSKQAFDGCDDPSGSVPTSSILPLATPSGRSVFSRRTSSGTPSAGASSCIPPESLRMMSARAHRLDHAAHGERGSSRRMPGLPASNSRMVLATCRIGVQYEIDGQGMARCASSTSASAIDLQPQAPAFAAVAGNQQADRPFGPGRPAASAVDDRQQTHRYRCCRLRKSCPVTPSASRFAALISVGAKRRVGHVHRSPCGTPLPARACVGSKVRSPASTWATGMRRRERRQARLRSALDVSPWTISRPGRSASSGATARATLRPQVARIGSPPPAIERDAIISRKAVFGGATSGCCPVRISRGG